MKYTITQLQDKAFLDDIKENAQYLIIHDMFLEAFRLARDLENALNENRDLRVDSQDLYLEYLEIIIKLKWVGLQILKEKDIIDLFQHSFTRIFKIEYYDVWEKLRAVLISIIVFEDRDRLKASIRNALANNKERLTKNRMIINGEEKEPTVANWIADYNRNLGAGMVDKLKLSQYLINSVNTRRLDESDKSRIKTLFSFFERLKLSSLTIEGVEEDIPIDEEFGKGVISQGVPRFYKTDEETKRLEDIAFRIIRERDSRELGRDLQEGSNNKVEELKNISAQYPVGSLERKAIEEEIKKLSKE